MAAGHMILKRMAHGTCHKYFNSLCVEWLN